jgi:hypothetical protein
MRINSNRIKLIKDELIPGKSYKAPVLMYNEDSNDDDKEEI